MANTTQTTAEILKLLAAHSASEAKEIAFWVGTVVAAQKDEPPKTLGSYLNAMHERPGLAKCKAEKK
jgi:hypothetical protein